MSASLFAKLLVVPRQLPAVSRLSWRTAASTGQSGGSNNKAGSKEPKKPADKPKTSGSAPPSGPTPAAPEPFDNTKYQATEQFEYNAMSFYDIEMEMSSKRCPVPSSLKKAAA